MRYFKHLLWIVFGLTLIGCGGGGGSTNTPTPIPTPSSSSSSSAVSSSEVASSSSIPGSAASSSSSSSVSGTPTITGFIVVDQFGYLPDAKKIAVVRDPQTGFDSAQSFSPSATYKLVNLANNETVLSASPTAWNNGATAPIAGDKAWWFDFSSVTTPGTYAIVDEQNNVRSPDVRIGADVYKPILKHAVRTFFYQRAGFAKVQPYAEAAWTDGASHIGAGQDKNARLYSAPNNASTERDLSGGWYDAGDYNKYTNWHADYLVVLLHAYMENPGAWTDDFNIPESGNGIPDLIDEIKWGFDWLIKMQEDNGSMLSVVGLSHASPPSAATGPTRYGPANTSATLTSAGAFALGAKVLGSLGDEALTAYANDLLTRAEAAWNWAEANPNVIFRNNDSNPPYNSGGLAAGQQEVDVAGRADKKRVSAIYLFDATGNVSYRTFVDANVGNITWVDPWSESRLTAYLYYASLPDATPSVANNLKSGYASAMNGGDNWQAVRNNNDPYRAFLGGSNFTWGSNRTMSKKGTTFYNLVYFNISGTNTTEVRNAALGYINYLHGMNPLGMAYLSNMNNAGAHSSVNEFYHSWFADGSSLWDSVGESAYGPAPGFLVGGPNPSYDWDSCCPNSCGSATNNNVCTSINLIPPKGQPAMKSYLDFNTSWPLNSWQITENHNDYQVAYIRLLSKFVN